MRQVKTSNEFFDILDRIGNGKFVTIGYVTGANLNVPTIKRKNPETNRMKGYPDYSVFMDEGDGEIGALVKISSYNMRYLNRTTVGKKYGEYKDAANAIRGEYGLDPIADKEGYKQGTSWSENGPELYKGQNDALASHSYNPQNVFGVKPKGVVYSVDKEGHIMKAIPEDKIKDYLGKKREVSGVAALRKMGMEEEKIKEFVKRMDDLKFRYINFESNSILWIAATINGEKIVYINDNLQRAVDGINIRPEDFREIARERYKVDLANLHESKTRKMVVRITESDLHEIIGNSVRKYLNEWGRIESDLDADEIYGDRADREQKQAMRDKLFQDDWEMRNRRLRKKYPGKSREWYEAMIDTFYEGKKEKKTISESFQNNQGYSHFAVNKATGKIVNGWDYNGYDPSELRQFKKDYFMGDLIDNDLNPKDYKILSAKSLIRMGIDPDDNNNWANS